MSAMVISGGGGGKCPGWGQMSFILHLQLTPTPLQLYPNLSSDVATLTSQG